MKAYLKKYTAWALALAVTATLSGFNVEANDKTYNRIVMLSPAAADIIEKCGAGSKVVGVTKHIAIFENAVKVGTHIRPNVEIIKSLKPDLIVYSSNRFFPENAAKSVGADSFAYNPESLSEVIDQTRDLCAKIGSADQSSELIKKMENTLTQMVKTECKPRVIYEIAESPYTVAGLGNVVADIVSKAGGEYIVQSKRKTVRYSTEMVTVLKPDFYIYQQGPMNKRPSDPANRNYMKGQNSAVLKVDQLKWARANSSSFENLLFLNKKFADFCKEK